MGILDIETTWEELNSARKLSLKEKKIIFTLLVFGELEPKSNLDLGIKGKIVRKYFSEIEGKEVSRTYIKQKYHLVEDKPREKGYVIREALCNATGIEPEHLDANLKRLIEKYRIVLKESLVYKHYKSNKHQRRIVYKLNDTETGFVYQLYYIWLNEFKNNMGEGVPDNFFKTDYFNMLDKRIRNPFINALQGILAEEADSISYQFKLLERCVHDNNLSIKQKEDKVKKD